MPEALVSLPDGRKAKVTFNTKDQLDATIADLTKAPTPGVGDKFKDAYSSAMNANPYSAVLEPALQMGAAGVGAVVGGYAGLGQGALNLGREALGNKPGMSAADRVAQVSGAIQAPFEPQTEAGQMVSGAVNYPFKKLGEGADVAGEAAAKTTGSPAVGAAVNTGIQMAPSLLGLRGARGAVAEEAPKPPPGASQSAAEATSSSAGAEFKPIRIEAGEAAGAKPKPTPNEARAKSYVRSIGIDWSRLDPETQNHLTEIAKNAKDFQGLQGKALERELFLKSQRVPITTSRGRLERDPVQVRKENIASTQEEGAPLRELDRGANRDLQANLEVLRGRVAGKRGGLHDPTEEGAERLGPSIREGVAAPEEVGRAIAGKEGALTRKAQQSKANYNRLYERARNTEPNAAVSAEPLYKHLEENPELQHTGWLQGWLKRAKIQKETVDADGNPTIERRPVTLKELHDLREKAGGIARAGGTDGYYASQVLKSIDRAMEEVPEGAKAWKEANRAYAKHQAEFKNQDIIRKLSSTSGKGSSTPRIAAEKVFQTIAKGSLDDVRTVKRSLFGGEDKATRAQGKAAWRSLRGAVANDILESARNVVATDEEERQILTAAALRSAINRYGRPKLNEILGKGNTNELYNALRAAKITRTDPSHRVTESGTVPNALVLAKRSIGHLIEKGVEKVPVVGKPLVEMKRVATERADRRADVKRATTTPLQQAAAQAGKGAPTVSLGELFTGLKPRGEVAEQPTAPVAATPPQATTPKKLGDLKPGQRGSMSFRDVKPQTIGEAADRLKPEDQPREPSAAVREYQEKKWRQKLSEGVPPAHAKARIQTWEKLTAWKSAGKALEEAESRESEAQRRYDELSKQAFEYGDTSGLITDEGKVYDAQTDALILKKVWESHPPIVAAVEAYGEWQKTVKNTEKLADAHERAELQYADAENRLEEKFDESWADEENLVKNVLDKPNQRGERRITGTRTVIGNKPNEEYRRR